MNASPSSLARRAGRIAFGVVLFLGMLVLAVFAIHYGFREMPVHAWQILLGTWLTAFATAAVVRTVTDCIAASDLADDHPWVPAGELTDDHERVAAGELADERQRVAALVLPAIGIALIAPLTVHAIVVLLVNLDHVATWSLLRHALEQFDGWAVASLALTGPAHVTFAALVGVRANRLAKGAIPVTVKTIYLATVIAACVPGILVVVPPFVVALTGLPMLPLLYWMEGVAERDREPRIALPTAVARVA
ncbi:MAG: hypothetical protein HOV81_17220 [Kofleriaceae bacterium]|nr:hypothetical protein [Kofleriaceae bacterium]